MTTQAGTIATVQTHHTDKSPTTAVGVVAQEIATPQEAGVRQTQSRHKVKVSKSQAAATSAEATTRDLTTTKVTGTTTIDVVVVTDRVTMREEMTTTRKEEAKAEAEAGTEATSNTSQKMRVETRSKPANNSSPKNSSQETMIGSRERRKTMIKRAMHQQLQVQVPSREMATGTKVVDADTRSTTRQRVSTKDTLQLRRQRLLAADRTIATAVATNNTKNKIETEMTTTKDRMERVEETTRREIEMARKVGEAEVAVEEEVTAHLDKMMEKAEEVVAITTDVVAKADSQQQLQVMESRRSPTSRLRSKTALNQELEATKVFRSRPQR